ncbi:MAG: hypothetical protein OEV20_07140 [Actinomycetota bacterium]|nr:hypothetical protein [Actinomycetota bacterium]
MNLDDMEKLKFDRRLEQRRGWLEPGEREAHLESLSDASDKIHDGSEPEAPAAPAPAASPEASAPPAAAAPAPPVAPSPDGGVGGSSI